MQGYAELPEHIDFEPSKGMQNRRKIIKKELLDYHIGRHIPMSVFTYF